MSDELGGKDEGTIDNVMNSEIFTTVPYEVDLF